MNKFMVLSSLCFSYFSNFSGSFNDLHKVKWGKSVEQNLVRKYEIEAFCKVRFFVVLFEELYFLLFMGFFV